MLLREPNFVLIEYFVNLLHLNISIPLAFWVPVNYFIVRVAFELSHFFLLQFLPLLGCEHQAFRVSDCREKIYKGHSQQISELFINIFVCRKIADWLINLALAIFRPTYVWIQILFLVAISASASTFLALSFIYLGGMRNILDWSSWSSFPDLLSACFLLMMHLFINNSCL